MKLILFIATTGLMFAQPPSATVSGKLVLDSSNISKKLYGRLPVFHGSVTLKNQGPATVSVGGADINLALSTVPTISASEGQALTNQAYAQQPTQRIVNIITLVAGGIGLASGIGSGITIGLHTLGYLLFGVAFGQQNLLPFFTAGNPPAPTFSPCDPINISLAAGQALNCDVWVEKPPKGAVPLNSVYSIDLESIGPIAPLPPTPPPVQLRRKVSQIDTVGPLHIFPNNVAMPASHADYGRQLYYAGEYQKSLHEYNMALNERAQATGQEDAGLWIETATGPMYQLGDESRELAQIILEHFEN